MSAKEGGNGECPVTQPWTVSKVGSKAADVVAETDLEVLCPFVGESGSVSYFRPIFFSYDSTFLVSVTKLVTSPRARRVCNKVPVPTTVESRTNFPVIASKVRE